jgi:hypothetical protein
MNQFSQPGYPQTAVPGQEGPGCSLIGDIPRTDPHHINLTARQNGATALLTRERLAQPATTRQARTPGTRQSREVRL